MSKHSKVRWVSATILVFTVIFDGGQTANQDADKQFFIVLLLLGSFHHMLLPFRAELLTGIGMLIAKMTGLTINGWTKVFSPVPLASVPLHISHTEGMLERRARAGHAANTICSNPESQPKIPFGHFHGTVFGKDQRHRRKNLPSAYQGI